MIRSRLADGTGDVFVPKWILLVNIAHTQLWTHFTFKYGIIRGYQNPANLKEKIIISEETWFGKWMVKSTRLRTD